MIIVSVPLIFLLVQFLNEFNIDILIEYQTRMWVVFIDNIMSLCR